MSKNIENSQGEIELGKLFALIGTGISNLFKVIINILSKLLHYIILALIFLKKNALYLGAAVLIGGAIGYFLESEKPEKYSSDMILETNFGSGHQLYSQKNYLNTLIDTENYETLSNIFSISKEEATTLSKFKVSPYKKEIFLQKEFDYYLQHTDTIFTSGMTAEDYDKKMDDADFRLQKVTAFALDRNVFNKLNNGIINIVENEHFKKLLTLKTNELNKRQTILEKNLVDIDSIRNRYKKVELLSAKNNNLGANTNIDLSGKQNSRNKDIDLFNQTNKILFSLRDIDSEKIKSGFITSVISEFKTGEIQNRIIYKLWFRFAIIGFLLALSTILALKLNRFLINYNKTT